MTSSSTERKLSWTSLLTSTEKEDGIFNKEEELLLESEEYTLLVNGEKEEKLTRGMEFFLLLDTEEFVLDVVGDTHIE